MKRWEVACLSSGFPPHLWLSHASESAKSTEPARALDGDFWSGALQILQMWPILLAHRTMHLAQCTLYLINSWLVVGSSCFQTQWPLKLVHPLERHCPFLPKAITILYRSPIINLAFAFILINCTMYKASWPWKLVHPHKRHCWVTTVTARGRDRETAIEVIAIILGHFCHHMVSRFCAVSSYFELQWRFC